MKPLLVAFAVFFAAASAHASDSDMMNFRFSPIGLIIGAVGVDLDFKIAPDWTIGPELEYWHLSVSSGIDDVNNFSVTAFGAGLRANWFLNGAFKDGLYIGPGVEYIGVNVSSTDTNGSALTAKASGTFAKCLVGYGWFWDSFNMMLGGGISTGFGTKNVTVTDSNGNNTTVSSPGAGFALEYSLGWTF